MRRYVWLLCNIVTIRLLVCSAAAGQAVPTASGPGSYVAVGGGISNFQADYGGHNIEGGLAYLDLNPQWRLGLEGEARFLHHDTFEQVTESTYLGGLRVHVLRPRRLQPYAKVLVGMGRITLPFGYAHGSFLTYAPGAGLDVALSQHCTLRVIDVEYQHWPAFNFGPLNPYGVSAGISVRLNPLSRYPRH